MTVSWGFVFHHSGRCDVRVDAEPGDGTSTAQIASLVTLGTLLRTQLEALPQCESMSVVFTRDAADVLAHMLLQGRSVPSMVTKEVDDVPW